MRRKEIRLLSEAKRLLPIRHTTKSLQYWHIPEPLHCICNNKNGRVLFSRHSCHKRIQFLLGIVLCNLAASDLGGDGSRIGPVSCTENTVHGLCHTGHVGLVYKHGCQRICHNFLAGACRFVSRNLLRQFITQNLILLIADKCSKLNCRNHIFGLCVYADCLGAVEA